MNLGVAFAPLVSAPHSVGGSRRRRASCRCCCSYRAAAAPRSARLALALIVLALANPSLTREDRDPLSFGRRRRRRQEPEPEFRRPHASRPKPRAPRSSSGCSHIPGLDVRVVEAGQADGETDGTRLFTALGSTLADVPPDRVAGVVMITDGRVHDVPADASALGFAAPVHALITGNKDERDRRVALIAAPRFGIVGQPQTITYRVEDQGAKRDAAPR